MELADVGEDGAVVLTSLSQGTLVVRGPEAPENLSASLSV